jgi:hypothetical protein
MPALAARNPARVELISDAPTTARIVDGILGPRIESPADPFVERMEEEADGRDRLVLAARALRHDPGCIEAHLLLAECAPNDALRLRHLQAAVRSGRHLWDPVEVRYGDDLCWWGFPGTRPYMRAIHALSEAHLAAGNEAAARWGFERLLSMNPYDNQSVRYSMESLEAAPARGM